MAYLQMYQVEAAQLLKTASDHELPLSTVLAPETRQFAAAHGFALTTRWLELELTGYRGPNGGPASIDGLLGVPPGHPLVERVLSYRILEGRFAVRFGDSDQVVPLPVQKLTVHSLAEIEHIANGREAAFEGPVPLMHLPEHPISAEIANLARARGEEFIRASFPREQFVGLLSGLRREILRMLSSCMSGVTAA